MRKTRGGGTRRRGGAATSGAEEAEARLVAEDDAGESGEPASPPASSKALKEVVIYCDGSSLGNGQDEPRAAAVALMNWRQMWRAFGLYLGTATNQQAEIAAAALGLEQLREPCRVRVLTDSRYVVETMKGHFRRKANHDWWARLDRALGRHRIEWEWVKGHAGHTAQEAVDRAARRLAALERVEESVLRDAEADVAGFEQPANRL